MPWLATLQQLAARVGQGARRLCVFESGRTRRALALLPLSFFALLHLLLALAAEPAWRPALLGLTACYLLAFLALGAEWFWARWFASGLGAWGLMVGLIGLVNLGFHAALAVHAGLHGAVVLLLRGPRVAALYDGRADWRERLELDAHGAERLGRTVRRTAGALPMLVFWALGPRQPAAELGATLRGFLPLGGAAPQPAPGAESATLAASWLWAPLAAPWSARATLVLAVVGFALLLRARSLGLLLLAAGALLGLAGAWLHGNLGGLAGTTLLLSALAPFARPLARSLRGP